MHNLMSDMKKINSANFFFWATEISKITSHARQKQTLLPVKVNADENMLGSTSDPGALWRECDRFYCKAMTNLPQNPHGHIFSCVWTQMLEGLRAPLLPLQTKVTKILLRVLHCARLRESHNVWSRGWCTHQHQALQCQHQGCPRSTPTPVHLTAPPQVEPQSRFSEDSAAL